MTRAAHTAEQQSLSGSGHILYVFNVIFLLFVTHSIYFFKALSGTGGKTGLTTTSTTREISREPLNRTLVKILITF